MKIIYRNRRARFVILISLTAILTNIFRVTLFGYFFGTIFFGLIILLLFYVTILFFDYVILEKFVFKIVIVLSISLLAAGASYFIDPVKADLFIYLIPRNLVIAHISKNQRSIFSEKRITSRLVVNGMNVNVKQDENGFEVDFPRYNIGIFDGVGADLIYRSDNKDISITSEQYSQNREKIKKVTKHSEPYFKEVRKIQNHWFWQLEEW